VYALGVKEIWKVKKAPEYITHTLGWPLPKDAFGGSFMYPMADDQLAVGLVVGLDYKNANLDTHRLLQHMKQHPFFKQYLDGGQCIEWGAKTIPEGGFHALPSSFTGDGLMMTGDAVGLVNVPALKGIHYAMLSGIYAARSIFQALKNGDTSKNSLATYDQALKESEIWSDLKGVRNMRHAFKDGFYVGGIKAALMTVTGGAFPGDGDHAEEDAAEPKDFSQPNFPTEKVGLSKVDAVYMSANKTRDDIPSHLTVGKDITPEMADFYAAMCPAGVYERQGDKLVVNAPNCVDCKATDVLGPRWQPREGGSGPDYKQM
jgi:electron-transferring-flavoprotein dehydrogenase